jgi:hypothetical protein
MGRAAWFSDRSLLSSRTGPPGTNAKHHRHLVRTAYPWKQDEKEPGMSHLHACGLGKERTATSSRRHGLLRVVMPAWSNCVAHECAKKKDEAGDALYWPRETATE